MFYGYIERGRAGVSLASVKQYLFVEMQIVMIRRGKCKGEYAGWKFMRIREYINGKVTVNC